MKEQEFLSGGLQQRQQHALDAGVFGFEIGGEEVLADGGGQLLLGPPAAFGHFVVVGVQVGMAHGREDEDEFAVALRLPDVGLQEDGIEGGEPSSSAASRYKASSASSP